MKGDLAHLPNISDNTNLIFLVSGPVNRGSNPCLRALMRMGLKAYFYLLSEPFSILISANSDGLFSGFLSFVTIL